MATPVRFPKIDANILEGQVGTWLKAEGDRVSKDEPLVELITDKANFELPSESDGVLRRIVASEKSVVPVGYILALLGEDDEPLPDVTEENDRILSEHRASAQLEMPRPAAPAKGKREKRKRVRATPAARRLARQHDVDLADVEPAEGGPVVSEEDVQRHLAQRQGDN